jgi:hypothetical protein
MKFNRENYEIYVIDFLEGKLTEEDHNLFIEFLKDNTDIYEEVKSIRNIHLQPVGTHFPGKNNLKKTIRTSEYKDDFENFCIASLEEDLAPDEKLNFESWLLKNPDKSFEYESFRKVYLNADMNIVFSPKLRLKKLSIVQNRIRLVSILSAAAAVTILFIFFIKSADIINHNVIKEDSNNELKITTEPEKPAEELKQINVDTSKSQEQESTDNQLVETELGNVSIEKQATQPKHNLLLTGNEYINSSREQILIKPVSPLLARIEIQSSVGNDLLQQPDREESRTFDDYQTLGEFAGDKILRNLLSANESDGREKLTFWDLASNSIEGLNRMTDGGYALGRETSENGTLKRISLETPLLGISIPIKNKHSQ